MCLPVIEVETYNDATTHTAGIILVTGSGMFGSGFDGPRDTA